MKRTDVCIEKHELENLKRIIEGLLHLSFEAINNNNPKSQLKGKFIILRNQARSIGIEVKNVL